MLEVALVAEPTLSAIVASTPAADGFGLSSTPTDQPPAHAGSHPTPPPICLLPSLVSSTTS